MTSPTNPQDVRELAVKALRDASGCGTDCESCPARVDVVLAAVTPVIRRQVAEEIAEAIEWRFEHFRPELHAAMISVAEWCAGEARRHSTQPGEETK